MEITDAVTGRQVCEKIRQDLANLRYNPDLQKMFRNIEGMITEISKLEVTCRRTRNRTLLETPLKELNESINHLNQYIIIAKLME